MDTEQPQKGEEYPSQVVVNIPFMEADIGLSVHRWNEKKIHEPADQKKSQGKKVNGAGNGFAIIKTMGANKTENPQQIAHERGVSLCFRHCF
jgi:hypothetical protein